ncbi:MAG: GNAT superfamily N-acetyltransferase [Shewanella sp.]|jgi:GNAT superfamily N-acetyltransferase
MNFNLVQASAEDRGFLLALRTSTMVDHLEEAGIFLTQKEHLSRLDEAYDCSYLIIIEEETVGTLKFRERVDQFEVMQLQIAPTHQGYGLGKMVLARVIQWSVSANKPVALTVLKANPAKELYLRLGFNLVGEDEYEFHMLRAPASMSA